MFGAAEVIAAVDARLGLLHPRGPHDDGDGAGPAAASDADERPIALGDRDGRASNTTAAGGRQAWLHVVEVMDPNFDERRWAPHRR